MPVADSHCHLDIADPPEDWLSVDDALATSAAVGVPRIVQIGCDLPGARWAVQAAQPHSECLTGDVLGSQRCDCGAQLRESVARIADAGGFLLYLRQGAGASGSTRSSTRTHCRTRARHVRRQPGAGLRRRRARLHRRRPDAPGAGGRAARPAQQQPGQGRPARTARAGRGERVPTGVHLTDSNARYLATKAGRGALPRAAGSAPVVLHDARRPHLGVLRVLAGGAQRVTLAEQVPALVELDLEVLQPRVLLVLADLALR